MATEVVSGSGSREFYEQIDVARTELYKVADLLRKADDDSRSFLANYAMLELDGAVGTIAEISREEYQRVDDRIRNTTAD